ncbi:MAG TPA: hypothetical protein VFG80_05515 [Myxococcota bacterium]|nr:hypothetical protein [Myxococcota bacterium]
MPDEARESTKSHTLPWEPPGFEVISLACEISGYAPDDQPLV